MSRVIIARFNHHPRCILAFVVGVSALLSIGGCSTNRSIYEARQRDARNACLNVPSGIERDKCLDRNSQSYDEYSREREKVQQANE